MSTLGGKEEVVSPSNVKRKASAKKYEIVEKV
jgi:hypothetical protein